MTEDRFEQFLQEAAREYHDPPPALREEMWGAIEAARRGRVHDLADYAGRKAASADRGWRRRAPWLRWGTGIAALLAVGFGIGRFTGRGAPTEQVAESVEPAPAAPVRSGGSEPLRAGESILAPPPAPAAGPAETRRAPANGASERGGAVIRPYQLAALQHLGQTEALLTAYRSGAPGQAVDRQVTAWSRDLLSTTRLLLDSPAGSDPQLERLLQELELLLAQIAWVSGGEDRQLVDQALDDSDVLTRLRAAVPAGPARAGT